MPVPWIQRLYVPAPGQPDAAVRATALNCTITTEAAVSRGASPWAFSLPAVVLYVTATRMEVIVEPTTLAAVDAAEAVLAAGTPPVSYTLGQHVGQTNPHGLSVESLGAAPAVHTHPEYEGGGGPHDHDGTYATSAHGHDLSAYSQTTHHHDAAYSPTGHTHAASGATGGVIRKTANQTMTATSQTAITDMSFSVTSGGTYWFRMAIPVTTSSGTSPTTAYGLTGPAGGPTVAVTIKQPTSTSVDAIGTITSFTNFAAGAQVANTMSEIGGVVIAGSQSGTVQLTVARGGTNPSMVIPAGANGVWMRLA